MSAVVAPLEPSSLGPEELARRWAEVVSDPLLGNLPYRLELNRWGHIEMTPPASPRHMDFATTLAGLLRERLGGKALTECAIATREGVRVADVVWCSDDFARRHAASFANWEASLSEAPELCVEVMSPSNLAAELREKLRLYLEAGAKEAWMVYPDVKVEVFTSAGMSLASSLGVDLTGIRLALQSL